MVPQEEGEQLGEQCVTVEQKLIFSLFIDDILAAGCALL